MGLDLSLSSPGIAVSRGAELLDSTNIPSDTSIPWYDRVFRTAATIHKWAKNYSPEFIFIENYSYGSINGRELMGEVHGVVLFTLHQSGFGQDIYRVVSPTQLKKFVTGKGNAKKQDIVKTINAIYGKKFLMKENDQADAYALCLIVDALVKVQKTNIFPDVPHQKDALKKILSNLRSDESWLRRFN